MLGLIARTLAAGALVLIAAALLVVGWNFLSDLANKLVQQDTYPSRNGRGGFIRLDYLAIGGVAVLGLLILAGFGGAYRLGVIVGRGELYETALNAQGQVIDLVPKVEAARAACTESQSVGPTVHRGAH